MSYPLSPGKWTHSPVWSAQDLIEYLRQNGKLTLKSLPPRVIFVFSPGAVKKLRAERDGEDHFLLGAKIWIPKNQNELCFVYGLGVGAPALVAKVEECRALGAQEFLLLGLAGSISDKLNVGDVVLVDRALRDEGCSYHYLSPTREVSSNQDWQNQVMSILAQKNIDYRVGPTWTIDTPYRETTQEIQEYRRQGVLCVDMETAAFYAVAQSFNLPALSLFVVSDLLSAEAWSPHFFDKQVSQKLFQLVKLWVR